MATPKDLPPDIGGFIRDLRQTAKISLRQLADKAGVSNPYLSQIERGLRKPSAEVLQQIASALRVSTPAMYLRAGLLDSEGQQGVLAAIAVDPELTIAQKQSLSQIYETFRNENARNAPAAEAGDPDEAGSEEDALLAAVAQAEADGELVAGPAETERETAQVVRDVAVVDTGAAPAPKTTTISNQEIS
jgi:transcriptional regulator with XRE-family HTH domain